MKRKALVIGASGLVGRELITLLSQQQRYQQVRLLLRRAIPDLAPEFLQTVCDFEELLSGDFGAELDQLLAVDDVFCCLGTTIKAVKGDKKAFYRVDHDYPVAIAALARKRGAQRLFVISAIGADAESRVFYNRVKGEMERDVKRIGYPILHIYRPSLLLGNRSQLDQPSRPAERMGQWLLPVVGKFMQGPLQKYQPTPASSVAKAMIADSGKAVIGVETHEFG